MDVNYSGYGIGFDAKGSFSHPKVGNAKNVTIFGEGLSSSRHANNRTNNILVLGKDFIQGINGTTIYAEGSVFPTNFTKQEEKFVLCLHCNGDNSYLFVNGVQQVKFKTKDSEIKQTLLCLGNISTEFSLSNIVKRGLLGSIYDFSVDYWPISTDKIQ